MFIRSSDLALKSIRTKQDQKLSTRQLSREISMTNSSGEVYYGGPSVAIPFMWESQPGTPKVKLRETSIPPLTPPPSFHFNPTKKPIKKPLKSNILLSVLPKLTLRTSLPSSPASSASSSSPSSSSSSRGSSSYSVPQSPYTPSTLRDQFRLPISRSSFDARMDEEDELGSRVSTFCFGIGRSTNLRSRGCSSSMIKYAVLAIYDHGINLVETSCFMK
ncbi:unnamed protein product [Ilex paraguariensis]|uniref:Uncharacterized protein n=1 Tax=Ilex paraguariensis TaxID=185542 RepID=A0ABC8TC75_9AQUA